VSDRDEEDIFLLRRIIVGLQVDLRSDLFVRHLARRRVVDARTMLRVIADRHADQIVPGSEWARAVEHVEDLCAEVERLIESSGA
jgi:hypothetical protein